jgi:hypothetical protein
MRLRFCDHAWALAAAICISCDAGTHRKPAPAVWSDAATLGRSDAGATLPGDGAMPAGAVGNGASGLRDAAIADAKVIDAAVRAEAGVARDAAAIAPGQDSGVASGCAGPVPPCLTHCGGDQLNGIDARCVGDRWHCDSGYLVTDCPAGSCFGVPLPGEACSAGQWVCRPDADTFSLCPNFACLSCDGFAGPVDGAGCRCACTPNQGVFCHRL